MGYLEDPTKLIVFLAPLFIAALVLVKVLSPDSQRAAPNVPIIGLRIQLFPWIRAALRSLPLTREWAFDGYSIHSKSNSFFVLPTIDRGSIWIAPPKQMKKLYGLADRVLDTHETTKETLQMPWTIGDRQIYDYDFHMNLVKNQLTRNLDILTPAITAEIQDGFGREWDVSNEEWTEIDVWRSTIRIIGSAANSAFFGPPICHDREFIWRLQDHASSLFLASMLINCTPWPFRYVVGTVMSGLCHYRFRRISALCIDLVKERLDNTAKLRSDVSFLWIAPKDGLQWLIEECYARNDPQQLKPERVLHRLVFLNDISLHSTSYTAQNVILDLASADADVIDALRKESAQVLAQAGGVWSRQAVQDLKLIDSTIRESMRLNPFNSIGLPRTVMHPEGIVVEQDGKPITIPAKTKIMIPVEPIQHDESVYSDATSFKPFRFAKPMSGTGGGAGSPLLATKDSEYYPQQQGNRKSSATIDDAFLGFGFGIHACPGRFFALNELKIFVATMVLNYDLQPLPERPKAKPVGWLNVPFFTDFRVGVKKRAADDLR
ncbi:ent-kaurene oxidase [Xylariaceae sp. FL0255]|nr:ent-kaurene oxidase [Xylariaceae sp. FL0255]